MSDIGWPPKKLASFSETSMIAISFKTLYHLHKNLNKPSSDTMFINVFKNSEVKIKLRLQLGWSQHGEGVTTKDLRRHDGYSTLHYTNSLSCELTL